MLCLNRGNKLIGCLKRNMLIGNNCAEVACSKCFLRSLCVCATNKVLLQQSHSKESTCINLSPSRMQQLFLYLKSWILESNSKDYLIRIGNFKCLHTSTWNMCRLTVCKGFRHKNRRRCRCQYVYWIYITNLQQPNSQAFHPYENFSLSNLSACYDSSCWVTWWSRSARHFKSPIELRQVSVLQYTDHNTYTYPSPVMDAATPCYDELRL